MKVKVTREALKGQQTVSAIASKYSVHPMRVSVWKQHLLKQAESVFDDQRSAISEGDRRSTTASCMNRSAASSWNSSG